jgi:hypothetical protein
MGAAFELRANSSSGEPSHQLAPQDAADRANVIVRGGCHLSGEELVDDVLHGAAPCATALRLARGGGQSNVVRRRRGSG